MSSDSSHDITSLSEESARAAPPRPEPPVWAPPAALVGAPPALAPHFTAAPPIPPAWPSAGTQPPPGPYDTGPGAALHPPAPSALPYAAVQPGQEQNGTGSLALALGIVSLVGFGALAGVPAVALGANGRKYANEGRATNGGAATSGLALGILGSLVWAMLWVVLLVYA